MLGLLVISGHASTLLSGSADASWSYDVPGATSIWLNGQGIQIGLNGALSGVQQAECQSACTFWAGDPHFWGWASINGVQGGFFTVLLSDPQGTGDYTGMLNIYQSFSDQQLLASASIETFLTAVDPISGVYPYDIETAYTFATGPVAQFATLGGDQVQAVPEPGMWGLVGLALLTMHWRSWRVKSTVTDCVYWN